MFHCLYCSPCSRCFENTYLTFFAGGGPPFPGTLLAKVLLALMTKHFANTGFRVGYIENPKENYSTALSSTAVSVF